MVDVTQTNLPCYTFDDLGMRNGAFVWMFPIPSYHICTSTIVINNVWWSFCFATSLQSSSQSDAFVVKSKWMPFLCLFVHFHLVCPNKNRIWFSFICPSCCCNSKFVLFASDKPYTDHMTTHASSLFYCYFVFFYINLSRCYTNNNKME